MRIARKCVLLCLSFVLSHCGFSVAPSGSRHPLGKDLGAYKPLDQGMGNFVNSLPYLNSLANRFKTPYLFGEVVIPYYVSDAPIGEVVIQKGSSFCFDILLCLEQMNLNSYPDISKRKIATIDLKIRSWFGIFSTTDILISYALEENKQENK